MLLQGKDCLLWLVSWPVEICLARGLVVMPSGCFGLCWGSASLALIHPVNSLKQCRPAEFR